MDLLWLLLLGLLWMWLWIFHITYHNINNFQRNQETDFHEILREKLKNLIKIVNHFRDYHILDDSNFIDLVNNSICRQKNVRFKVGIFL